MGIYIAISSILIGKKTIYRQCRQNQVQNNHLFQFPNSNLGRRPRAPSCPPTRAVGGVVVTLARPFSWYRRRLWARLQGVSGGSPGGYVKLPRGPSPTVIITQIT